MASYLKTATIDGIYTFIDVQIHTRHGAKYYECFFSIPSVIRTSSIRPHGLGSDCSIRTFNWKCTFY